MVREHWQDDGAREDERAAQSEAMVRSLEEQGVEVTGSESNTELTIMKNAVDGFRRAAEVLAGPLPAGGRADDVVRQVVPPRAADETARQYAERVNRMSERFRALCEGSSRDRPR